MNTHKSSDSLAPEGAIGRQTRWQETHLSQDYIPPTPWTAVPCETDGSIGGDEAISGAGLRDANGDSCFSLDLGADCAFFNNATVAFIARRVNAHDDLVAALKALSEHMDRAGGDAHGMPECPWCHADGNGDDHRGDCELLTARAALAKAEGKP